MPFTDQGSFDVRCEWGAAGVEALSACRTFIVVDVLSFSTCVAVAASRQAVVLPHDATIPLSAADFALSRRATLAGPRGRGPSLSPCSLQSLPAGTRLVLPSPNGAAVSLRAAASGHVLAGCLRNRAAVCARAITLGGPYAVIPAGERWSDGTLRPSLEDLLAAGAIISRLPGARSPEAAAAVAAFDAARLADALAACSSGRELIERGFPEDVEMAATLDADGAAELSDGEFVPSVSV
jgi:2-phosphosulfolactate phosphatase